MIVISLMTMTKGASMFLEAEKKWRAPTTSSTQVCPVVSPGMLFVFLCCAYILHKIGILNPLSTIPDRKEDSKGLPDLVVEAPIF